LYFWDFSIFGKQFLCQVGKNNSIIIFFFFCFFLIICYSETTMKHITHYVQVIRGGEVSYELPFESKEEALDAAQFWAQREYNSGPVTKRLLLAEYLVVTEDGSVVWSDRKYQWLPF
jgi:hypothetical protein